MLKTLKTIAVIIVFFFSGCRIASANIENLDKHVTKNQLDNMLLIDASPLAQCQKDSVRKAKCLPANTFQSKQGVLASFYDITWVFGTVGLKGSEDILVFANDEKDRDALLALLYLSGHMKLSRWNASKTDLQKILIKGVGTNREIVRTKYYIATMRDQYLVSADKLKTLKKLGWKESVKDSITNDKTIVLGATPLQALARFTRLLMKKTDTQTLKLFIH